MEKKTYPIKAAEENLHLFKESLEACGGDFSTFFANLKEEFYKDDLAEIYSILLKNIKDVNFLDALIREINLLGHKKNLDDLIDFLLEFDKNSFSEEEYGAYITLRVLCLKAISNYKDVKSIPSVLYCLNNKNEHYKTRLAAAEALGKIGDKNAVESLINVVSDEEEKSVYVRESAAVALGLIGDMRAIDPFLSILEAKKNFLNKFTFLKERVIEALGKFSMPYNKRVFNALKDALSDDSPQVRLNAIESLMNLELDGENNFGGAELIKNMLHDDDEEVARNAVTALYNLLGEGILKEILKDENMPYYCREEAGNILEEELLGEEDE